MLARAALGGEMADWNRRWGAPWGLPAAAGIPLGERFRSERLADFGPFAFQSNNSTREFEYPWAWGATPLEPGMTAVEVGGSLAGFQFALAQSGLRVINVDPGEDGSTGTQETPLTAQNHDRLNAAFATSVELRRETLEQVALPADSVDRVFCISTMEHIPTAALTSLLPEIHRVLRPGGNLVLTVDLMLDLAPFTPQPANEWGTNIDIHWAIETSGLRLVAGDPTELHGFPGFDPSRVEGMLDQLVIGRGHPSLVQALVLEKAPFYNPSG